MEGKTEGLAHNVGGPPLNGVLDLIWGVEDIGKLIGRNYQQTYNMIATGKLPMVRKIGERYVASRAKLVAFFMDDAA